MTNLDLILTSSNTEDVDKAYTASRELLRNALTLCGQIYFQSKTDSDHFFSLPVDEKKIVIQDISEWAQTILEAADKGVYVSSTKDLVRYYLHRLGVKLPQEFVDQILDGDIVELYKPNQKRMFFSPALFSYSSYGPDEMFSTRWWQLYTRDPSITADLQRNFQLAVSGEKNSPFDPGVESHVVSEVASELKYQSEMKFKLFSPIMIGEKVIGVACLSRLKLLLN